jgi:diadenosine tetraphosphatase ApaH/serine/threonine PP2A family protein phosphatase
VATAILYDVHGNLVALEAVLAEAEQAGATEYVLGGDYATFGPWPRETAERLEAVPAVVRIRGNVERWLRDEPDPRPVVLAAVAAAQEALGAELVRQLYELPERDEFDGMLVCHGSPLSDVDSFAREPEEGEERLLVGEAGRTILFGHSHVQFRRPGPDETVLVNPGSVGMPLDGDVRAAWALFEDGDIELRRTEYDVERAAAQMRTWGDWAEPIVYRIEHGADAPQ